MLLKLIAESKPAYHATRRLLQTLFRTSEAASVKRTSKQPQQYTADGDCEG